MPALPVGMAGNGAGEAVILVCLRLVKDRVCGRGLGDLTDAIGGVACRHDVLNVAALGGWRLERLLLRVLPGRLERGGVSALGSRYLPGGGKEAGRNLAPLLSGRQRPLADAGQLG